MTQQIQKEGWGLGCDTSEAERTLDISLSLQHLDPTEN